MPVSVACSKCGAKYRLADSLAGKSVRCKKCRAVFQVSSANQSSAAPPKSKTAKSTTETRPAPPTWKALQDLVVDAPLTPDPPVDPLLDDLGGLSAFEDFDTAASAYQPSYPHQVAGQYGHYRAPGPPPKKRIVRRKGRRPVHPLLRHAWWIIALVIGGMELLTFVVSLVFLPLGVLGMVLTGLVFMAIFLGLTIWGVILGFQFIDWNNIFHELFNPIYRIVRTIEFYQQNPELLFATLSMIGVQMFGVVLILFYKIITGSL